MKTERRNSCVISKKKATEETDLFGTDTTDDGHFDGFGKDHRHHHGDDDDDGRGWHVGRGDDGDDDDDDDEWKNMKEAQMKDGGVNDCDGDCEEYHNKIGFAAGDNSTGDFPSTRHNDSIVQQILQDAQDIVNSKAGKFPAICESIMGSLNEYVVKMAEVKAEYERIARAEQVEEDRLQGLEMEVDGATRHFLTAQEREAAIGMTMTENDDNGNDGRADDDEDEGDDDGDGIGDGDGNYNGDDDDKAEQDAQNMNDTN